MNKKEATIIIKTRKDSHGHLVFKLTLPLSWLGEIIKELGRLGATYDETRERGGKLTGTKSTL